VTGTTGVTGAAGVVTLALDVTAVGAAAGVILCFTVFPGWCVWALERETAARCLTTTSVDTRRLVPTGVA
jgi:hypothetical protein